jgi:hypothetical protein
VRLLVLTSEPITSGQLRDALPNTLDPQNAEVMVVAPALQDSPLKFWLSDADDAIEKARWVGSETVNRLGQEGVAASGDTGESDPVEAIGDALTTFPADRVVLFTHPGSAQRYREDVDASEIADRFGLPVDHATVGGASAE